MKTVTAEYKDSMESAFRSQSEVRITIIQSSGNIVFESDSISNMTQTTDIDPISRRLPTETLEFSVLDTEGTYNPVAPSSEWEGIDANAEILLEYGYQLGNNTVWLSSDSYVLSGKPTYSKGIALFKANKKLATLTGTFYKEAFTSSSYTYEALAIQVLADAGLSSSEYVLDDYLSSYNSSAPIPIDTHKNCLQMIAHACGCALYTDSNGKITIKHIIFFALTPLDFHLTRRDIVRGTEETNKLSPIYKTEAYKYSYYETETEAKEVYRETITTTDTTDYHIEFEAAKNVIVNVNGSEISANVYAQSADFTLVGSGETTIIATGYPVKENSSVYTKLVSSDSSGGIDTMKNPIVTDYSVCAILAENTALYLQYRNTNYLSYRGNPELQALDCIYYTDGFGTLLKALVLKNTIKFNGALSGELILKNLSEIDGAELYDSLDEIVYDNTDEAIMTTEPKKILANYTTAQINQFIGEVI